MTAPWPAPFPAAAGVPAPWAPPGPAGNPAAPPYGQIPPVGQPVPSAGDGGWHLDQATGQPIWRPAAPPASRWTTKRAVAVVAGSVVGLAALVLGALGVVGLVGGDDDAKEPVAAPSPVAAASVTPSPTPLRNARLTEYDYEPGKCYFWERYDRTPDVEEVPCAEPHMFESVTAPIDLSSEYPSTAPFPQPVEWLDLSDRYCQRSVEVYLGTPVDPDGRIMIEPIKPDETGWDLGDREMTCGVQVFTSTPDDPVGLLSTGSAKGLDQSLVWGAGVCLTEEGIPLVCSLEHAAVAVGDVVLPGGRDTPPPSYAEQEALIGSSCLDKAREFFGPSFQETETTDVVFYLMSEESWSFGNRTISCLVAYFNADGSTRLVTGEPGSVPA